MVAGGKTLMLKRSSVRYIQCIKGFNWFVNPFLARIFDWLLVKHTSHCKGKMEDLAFLAIFLKRYLDPLMF